MHTAFAKIECLEICLSQLSVLNGNTCNQIRGQSYIASTSVNYEVVLTSKLLIITTLETLITIVGAL